MIGWFAETTLVAAGLAALAVFSGRSLRLAPEGRHALWLVVLAKFLIPPVVAWPWGTVDFPTIRRPIVEARAELRPGLLPIAPAFEVASMPPPPPTFEALEPPMDLAELEVPELPDDPFLAEPAAPVVREAPEVFEPASRPAAPDPPRPAPSGPGRTVDAPRLDGSMLLILCWVVGTVAVAARGLGRIARFRRTLTRSTLAPGWLVEEVASVGDRLGVKPPPVLVSLGLPTPLLWCLGAPRLVVPESLGRLTPAARSGLIAHELAHLARWDHWVVRLELLAGLIWWWNPVFRFARRRLHDEAEAACDARVVRAFPDRRFAYAEALVQVCEAHARPAPPLPALGLGGAWAARTLEARLTMILRDPIRPPSRRASLGAFALLALFLPSWTLGRQEPAKPADPPKVETPQTVEPPKLTEPTPTPAPKPDKPEPDSQPQAATPSKSWTMDQIRDGFQGRHWPDQGLTFRCSVVARQVDRSRVNRISVQVADVFLGTGSAPGAPGDHRLGESSKLDVLTAKVDRRNAIRRFIAETPTDLVTFCGDSDQSDPVALRWLSGRSQDSRQGDDLAWTFNPNQVPGGDTEGLDPINPRPANLLDLQGSTPLLFQPNFARMELAGVEVVDGAELVRVAWITQLGTGEQVHGLCWVAPSLGFAVVRFEASANLSVGDSSIRRTWSKVASNFEKVGEVWLPRKVTYRTTNGPGNPNEMPPTTDLVATFEDYRANPPLAAETFKPRFNIASLDPETGNFTANPPEVPPGLVDLLNRAEAASPFGPPRVEALTQSQPAKNPDQPSTAGFQRTMVYVPRSARASNIANPAGINPPPTPQEKPTVQNPARARPEKAPEVEGPSQPGDDSELAMLQREVARLEDRLRWARNVMRNDGGVTERNTAGQLAEARSRLDQFQKKTISPNALLQARRDAQAAEVHKFEAKNERAQADAGRAEALNQRNVIGREEYDRAKFEAKMAEAEVAREKAKLAEADALLDQAMAPPATGSDLPTSIGRPIVTLNDYRDLVELAAMQLQIKQSELQRAESKTDRARRLMDAHGPLAKEGRITQLQWAETQNDYGVAQDEVKGKAVEVREAELRLKQAKRRADFEEGRLKRLAERTKVELDRARELFQQKITGARPVAEVQGRYDDLMFQLDPDYKPESSPPENPAPTAQPGNSPR